MGMRELAALIAPEWPQLLVNCAANALNMWNGGNQWSDYVAWLSFFRHVVKLDLDYSKYQHYEAAAIHGGPRVMHADFCIVSDRPVRLLVDADNRPHSEDGPFCAWADGTALWAWHGTRVPAWIITNPERITVQRIQQEENAELRRVLLERYGYDRFLTDCGATPLHRDECGELYRVDLQNDEPIVAVMVTNSTPEPDGHFKRYMLRVHPELRPMRTGGELGKPQAMTARNAVASTFGLRGEQYQPAMET